MFKSFFRWIGLRLGLIKGSIDQQNDRLMRDPKLIRQEGEAAAAELKTSYKQLYEAIAGKVRSRTEKETRIKDNGTRLGLIKAARDLKINADGRDSVQKIGFQLFTLSKMVSGATSQLRARAKTIGAVDANGNVDRSNPEASQDTEFNKHLEALTRFVSEDKRLRAELDDMERSFKTAVDSDTTSVRATNTQLITDKARLREIERNVANLPGEIEDIISDVLGAEEAKKRNAVLQSIDTSSAENRLANLKRLQQKAISEGSVANEMSSGVIDTEYSAAYADISIDEDIDALLNPNREKAANTETNLQHYDTEYLPRG